jgi:glycosyltransferase involved in cell wall biosynthesis
MRIALLVWTARGGAFANLSRALAKGLHASGADEVLLTYIAREPDADLGPGIRSVPLGVARARHSIPAIRRFLQEEAPDVLIPMLPLVSIPAVMAGFLLPRRRTKIVIFHSDTLSSDYRIDHRWSPRMRALPLAARLAYPRADALVAETDALRDLLAVEGIRMGRRPVGIIPPPVDVEAIRRKAAELPHHPWLVEKRAPVITSLGRLVKRKNFPFLIEAVEAIGRERDVQLVIYGGGPEREAIQRHIDAHRGGARVSLAGYVENPFPDISRSDVFVMPSLDEAFCLAIAEAMSCGVPVVSSDAAGGGPRFILQDGKFGTLVPVNDARALTTAIRQLLDDDALALDRAQQARRRADDFEPRRIGAQWLQFLDERVLALGRS